ncbi:thiaminase II [Polaribacter cellanae]|uniref:Aminopyrimidine aminohydrolase n=1 Tax=Polaribacter cellanae TaxID=2818493 RepID=A0A975H6N0_9FLAO|nr:thiaminase II [Polaribacter cellanae]QTE22607.1 thiaminase II [Polaribacter cellanae]
MNWSTNVWKQIQPIYNRILNMPFIAELTDGTLPKEKFKFYMAQDSHYLEHFGRSLSLIASRIENINDTLTFIRFAEGAIVVENALHESYFKDFNLTDKGSMQPSCHHYAHTLKSTATLANIEVAVAAVLPCFWIYREVGHYITTNLKSVNNPYQKWIDTYGGEEFNTLVEQAIKITDRLALNCTKAQQNLMTDAFITSSHLEYQFWDGAYNLRTW